MIQIQRAAVEGDARVAELPGDVHRAVADRQSARERVAGAGESERRRAGVRQLAYHAAGGTVADGAIHGDVAVATENKILAGFPRFILQEAGGSAERDAGVDVQGRSAGFAERSQGESEGPADRPATRCD